MEARAPSKILELTMAAAFSALVAAMTLMVQIPVPATGGYINIGDAMIFIGALVFGPLVGGLAGGIGSAIADMISYPVFAPYTLVVKGIEGAVVGRLRKRTLGRDGLACILGGVCMMAGYFVVEAFAMGLGIGAGMAEVPGNFFQVAVGTLIATPVAGVLRRALPSVSAAAKR